MHKPRFKWMIQSIADSLGVTEKFVEDSIRQDKNFQKMEEFLAGKGTPKIFIYYHPPQDVDSIDMKDAMYDNYLFVTDGEHEKLRDKAVYFFRNTDRPVTVDNPFDNEVLFGEILPNAIGQLESVMSNVYDPLVNALDEWGECDEDSKLEFLNYTKKFTSEAEETIKSLVEGVSITNFDHREYKEKEKASEKERLEFLQRHFAKWLDEIERQLRSDDAETKKESSELGPKTELVFWRAKMQKITNLSEQLKSADFKLAKEELWKERSKDPKSRGNDENIQKLMTQFNLIDITITDKLNEAKDNVKYLTTLEKFIEPLYTGTPQEIIDTLPALMSAIKMVYTIARYYNTNDKMTTLFVKITNQMIASCKSRIQQDNKSEKIWERNPEELIKELENCVSLNHAYQKEYNVIKGKVNELLKERQFEFNTATIFGKFDLFCRRVRKLIDIFSTIMQFNALKKHNFEGVGDITDRFDVLIGKFKAKRYDLLDYQNNKFDRDFVQFNVEIGLLDNDLQNFINSNFQRFRNIEYSLKLLKKFESILVRDSLKHDLSSKYHHILNNYSAELSFIGRIFGECRNDPPLVHNMPPVAGKIIWARHLFQKISKPINDLNTITSNTQELKKYFGTYNNLGKQLTVYETWYFQNWKNNIEEAKKGLQATLIVPHQKDDGSRTLIVNFDLDVFELIREAKCLERCGKDIGDAAKIILLQEEKFKNYYNELNYLLREYTRILGKIKHITKDILKPHTEDLEFKLRPGMLTLTWTSMNIDAFLKHVHQGLSKLEQLIININDIIDNRIENNLKIISKVLLVDLQESKPLSLEEFVKKQQEFIQENTRTLMTKNLEVERAVDDLLKAILNYPLDPHVDPVSQEEAKRIKSYYIWYMYQALLNSTQNSLNAMKYRVVGKRGQPQASQESLKPFFEVDVQLNGSNVRLNPSLEDIQHAINRAANAVLKCSKNLFNWNQQDKPIEERGSFYEMIAQEKEIVKVIIYLTGSIQGAKNKVNEVLSSFDQFEWLWKESILNAIKKFNDKNPRIASYEEKLKLLNETEQNIELVDPVFKIGAMALKTDNLKQGLLTWVKEWKAAYAEDLHTRAKGLLDQLSEQTKNLQGRLQKEVKDIDSLRIVMETLEEIRKQEAEIDMRFGPVFEMYDLYGQFLPNSNLDNHEMDARSVLKRNWQLLIQDAEGKKNDLQAKQGSFLKELKEDVKTFITDVQKFRKDYETNGPMVPNITPKDAIERLRRFDDEYGVREKKFEINRAGENLFGLRNQQYPALDKTKSELKSLKQLYDLYSKVIEQINEWRETTWGDLTGELLAEMEESITKFSDQCIKLPKDLKEWNAYKELKLQIDSFKDVLPLLQALKKPSIQPRHWKQVIEITGKELNYEQEDGFYLNDILEANLLDHKEDIEDIADSADKQLKIQSSLEEIRVYWIDAEFNFSHWKTREVPCVLNGTRVAEVTEKLDEDSQTLASLNAQRHVAPFAKPVQDMILTLSDVAETLDQWIKVQVMWTNLEAVFTSGDIAKQMPLEAKKFQGIDKNWLKIMEKASEIKKVVQCCQYDMLKTFLPGLQEGLETCQKSLEQYLEGKRKMFPRFYFVSNPALLKILSQGSDLESIQDDFEKLFDAIARVNYEREKKTQARLINEIISFWGSDSETVRLDAVVKCEGNIETWLENLKNQMQETMKDLSKRAWDTCLGTPLRDFVLNNKAQVALLGIQMIWTYKMEEGLRKRSDKQLWQTKVAEIEAIMKTLTAMCLEADKPLDRCKIETLVTIQVHQRDITAEIKSKDENDFEWQKQTRIAWKNEVNDIIISITDWDSPYSYEYLGAKERLAITPLTDRCYIALAQALSMYYGGAPAGPAGTGKTETVKDLGRTLGVFVVVTNCSDQHRYKDMAKIFKGLCQSGLWGCFDEFNRIDLEVLSVVAQQVEAIGLAKKQHLKTFMFPGEPQAIGLVQSVGYFITMNPGYAGRQELPENLKVLFRGVAMMVPDREIIIKVKLASVGYNEFAPLAKKFRVLYGLCEEQLSKQRHYDFGLRNILSVLRTAGNTKRQEITSQEEMLLMRTLRDMNLSKLVADDVPLFKSLLTDIFPKQTDPVKKTYPEIEKKVKELIPHHHLIFHDDWVLKIIQLYETCLVRHGFMMVGPTGTGKTTIMNLLTEAISDVKVTTRIQRMNPKAITAQEMYGVKSEISDDWIPGIFSEIWTKANDKKQKTHTWIVCDGPVDAIWIENLNTVLDDNKILTLASGDRIPMSDNCKLVFEVENLNNASPATVSRCGIVFVSSTDLGYEPVYKGWLLHRTKVLNRADEADKLAALFDKYFNKRGVVEFEEKQMKNPVMQLSSICKVINLLNLLTGILMPVVAQSRSLSLDEYERIFVWCLSWAFAGVYEAKERMEWVSMLASKNSPLPPRVKDGETIFEFHLDTESKVGSVDYKRLVPDEWKPPEKVQFSQLLLPTVDAKRAEILITYIANQTRSTLCSKSCLLVGGSGTAKTSSVIMYSGKFKENMIFKRINFSSATQPNHFQASIEAECDTKQGKNYSPPGNKQMTVFIDDMSMPFVNKWGDQITLEIVRQLIEQGGFYHLEKNLRGQFKNIINLLYVGAMNHPGGGRNDIPNRLKRQFFIFNMILPASVDGIYGSIIKHMFKPKNYPNEFNKVVEGLTGATIKIWNKVKNSLLPTPNKFHYVFNLRDLSRIFKGVVQIRRDVIMEANAKVGLKPEIFLIALWKHECERVFVDKLINQKDKDMITDFIQNITEESFPQHENDIREKLGPEKTIFYCDFLRPDVINEEGMVEVEGERVYEAITNIEALRTRAYDLLKLYNQAFPAKKMNLVLFDDALKHLLRVSRIIKMSRSSALLVGVGGSGKQSLTRLAAHIGKHIIHQIRITKNFGEKDLKEELKFLMEITGHQGKPVTFILTDAEVKQESFLEYINMVLSTGEIPGLIAKDEKEAWLGDIRNPYTKERGLPSTFDPPQADLYQYFVDRLRDNLHIVLCFSPVGPKFRERARKFPALFNECTIDWFLPWPEEALISVAQRFITEFKELDTTDEVKGQLQKHMGQVHLMVNNVCEIYFQKLRRQVYVTPKSFLSFIDSYKGLYMKKYYQELDVQERRFKVGLEKIEEASRAIAEMSVVLREEEQQVKEASEKTDALLKDLEKENKKAKAKQDEVEATAAMCQSEAAKIAKEKDEAQKDLDAAIPALQAAKEAVDAIQNPQIVELKQMRNPLDIMKYVMDCVCILVGTGLAPISPENKSFDKKDATKITPFMKDSWEESGRSLLMDIDFLKKIKNENLGNMINEEQIELLQPYFQTKEEFFNATQAKKASMAIEALCKWVFALALYYEKSKIVKPKMEYLEIQEGKLEVAMINLGKAEADLAEVKAFVAQLREKYQKQIEEKNALEDRSRRTKNKIDRARKLIDSLADEKERWTKGRDEIAEQKRRLVGNVSMSCAFISYCGPFNAEFRALLVNEYFVNDMKKKQIPCTPSLELTKFLIDDATIGEWNLQGLPKDDLSIQNGIMVTSSSRFALLIDPQGQGGFWIKNKYAEFIDPRRSITTLTHPKFKDFFLKYCIEEGKTLIIEGIENEVDPLLDPVLEKQFIPKGKKKHVDVGGTEMEWSEDFRMFLTCKLANPSFSPELSAKTTIIDFTVTQGGLEQQLLGRLLSKEKKALEESLNQLLTEVTQNKKNLQLLDKSLLEKLTESKGNLLENQELVEVLNTTKTEAKSVQAKLIEAEVKTKEINEQREQFRPVAIRGSVLYFCIIEMSIVNWMYNSSLGQFLQLFDYSIDNSEKAPSPNKRVDNIIRFLTYHVYRYINRGLFERDKVTYLLMVCFNIMLRDGKINGGDVAMFLKAGSTLDVTEKSPMKFIEDSSWNNCRALAKHTFQGETVPFFRELIQSFERNETTWKPWIEGNAHDKNTVPDFAERLSSDKDLGAFLHLCLVRCIREDRTLVASSQFISEKLGPDYVAPITDSIESIWQESQPLVPVLYLLSAGADPTSAIDEFSKKRKKIYCDKVSMGEGQDKYADESIKNGLNTGQWTILQNCHLGLQFMQFLDGFLTQEQPVVNPEFRLFITCEPSNRFPLGLLQKCIKVTNEPPKGIKAGLHKTFTTIVNQDFLDKIEHRNWTSLVYAVCFMHSIVQERRKFGPLGWCVPYEYNNSDLEASLMFIEKYLNALLSTPLAATNNLPIKWEVVNYMVCQVQYGGRITDDLDRELFDVYGAQYLNDKLFGDPVLADTKPWKYKVPQGNEIAKYREYIEHIPPIDTPEVFGLHDNADLTFRLKESNETINTIMETRPKDGGGGGGKTREEEVLERAKDYLLKLPVDYIDIEVRDLIKRLPGPKNLPAESNKGFSVPLNIFLYQEIQRMQRVISLVRKTLVDCIDAIDGIVIMTPFLLDAINAIYDGKVPYDWLYDPSGAEISWLLLKLSTWMDSLTKRNDQLKAWLNNGRPQTFWLGGFFNPQGFLTATKQEVTRMHKGGGGGRDKNQEAWSLDDVVYHTAVKEHNFEQIKDVQSEGVYVRELYLESATWGKGGLEEPPEKKNFNPLPILYVSAIAKKKGDSDKVATYSCPVYKYPRRTDKYLIFRVNLEVGNKTPSWWKLRGVALHCFTEN